jgi:predicted RNase H-like nuclease (RuvC/YqgF family)
MSSDQKAVIALINRSMLLIRELNETRRVNRDLERRLSESQDRVMELEAKLAGGAGGSSSPLRAA